MKRFSWPLDRLLDLKTFREKEAEIELGKANAIRAGIEAELDAVARSRVKAAQSRVTGLGVNELLAIEYYVKRLDGEAERLLARMAEAEMEVERRRLAFIERSRERNVLTRLREKKEGAWHKKYLAEEAASLDDIASSHDRSLRKEKS